MPLAFGVESQGRQGKNDQIAYSQPKILITIYQSHPYKTPLVFGFENQG